MLGFRNQAFSLIRLITESIANKYGAIDEFFDRLANKAQELPPRPKRRIEEIRNLGYPFPLRLFCYRISVGIVVLFNGGIKSAETTQESNDLSLKFYEAQTFVGKIEDAINHKMILQTPDGVALHVLCTSIFRIVQPRFSASPLLL